MSKIEAADHIKFLVACIGNTNNGRPDFSAVAQELGIVSKGAAQKRYERLLKSYQVNGSATPKSSATAGDTDGLPSSPATPTPAAKRRRAPATPRSNKKAKAAKSEPAEDTVTPKKEDADEAKIKPEDETEGSALSDAPEDLEDPSAGEI